MERKKVVVVNTGYAHFEIEKELLAQIGAELQVVSEDCAREEQVIAAARQADAVLAREAPFTARVVAALERCRIIARYGVGVDNIDRDAAAARRIYVSNVPGYCNEEVSDHTVALILACLRNLIRRDRLVRQGIFESDIDDAIHRSTGRVLGLVGYGQIARAVRRKWSGFLPAQVLVHDPFIDEETARRDQVRRVDLRTLLASADIVSLHAPLTEETRHLIRAETLAWMKPGAILVNASRGGLVQEAALLAALQSGQLRAAGLDVFEAEPIDADHPLTKLDNVVLSGHVAWYSKEAILTLQTEAAKEVVRVLTGQRPKSWVNPWNEGP